MKRYDIEGMGVVYEDNAALAMFCQERHRVEALEISQTANKVKFQSGAGTDHLDVTRVSDADSPGPLPDVSKLSPEVVLQAQRNLASRILHVNNMVYSERASVFLVADAVELARLVEAFDRWMCQGGYVPRAWRRD